MKKTMRERLEDAEAKANCFERSFNDIWWMARRYADGRRTYAPATYNEAIDRVSPWRDTVVDPICGSAYADDGDLGKWSKEHRAFIKQQRNIAKCRKCGDIIESKSRHDFVRCKCGAIFLDGGFDYVRRGGDPLDFVEVVDA